MERSTEKTEEDTDGGKGGKSRISEKTEGDLIEGTTDGGADGGAADGADEREDKLRMLLSSSESNLIDERVGVCSEGISASSDGAISAVTYSDPLEGSEIVR